MVVWSRMAGGCGKGRRVKPPRASRAELPSKAARALPSGAPSSPWNAFTCHQVRLMNVSARAYDLCPYDAIMCSFKEYLFDYFRTMLSERTLRYFLPLSDSFDPIRRFPFSRFFSLGFLIGKTELLTISYHRIQTTDPCLRTLDQGA